MIIDRLVFNIVFGRQKTDDSSKPNRLLLKLMSPDFDVYRAKKLKAMAEIDTYPYKSVSIITDDNLKLIGRLYRAENPGKCALLIHGYASYGLRDHADSALFYLKNGFSVLVADNRGCGESEGSFQSFGIFESRDSAKWVELLENELPGDRIIIQGCSLGGASVCMMSEMELSENVACLVSDCSFLCAMDIMEHVVKSAIGFCPKFVDTLIRRAFKKYASADIDDACPVRAVRYAKHPVMFVHGTEDHYISPSCAKTLFDNCRSKKKLLYIEGAGHAASSVRDSKTYYDNVLEFFNNCL